MATSLRTVRRKANRVHKHLLNRENSRRNLLCENMNHHTIHTVDITEKTLTIDGFTGRTTVKNGTIFKLPNAVYEIYDGYTIIHVDSLLILTQAAVTRNADGYKSAI